MHAALLQVLAAYLQDAIRKCVTWVLGPVHSQTSVHCMCVRTVLHVPPHIVRTRPAPPVPTPTHT